MTSLPGDSLEPLFDLLALLVIFAIVVFARRSYENGSSLWSNGGGSRPEKTDREAPQASTSTTNESSMTGDR